MTDITTAARRALDAWDSTVLPVAHDGRMQEAMECLRAAVPVAQEATAPAGYALVPLTPTEEMHVAAVRTIVRCTGNDDFPPRVWAAMLAAAPAAQPATTGPAILLRVTDPTERGAWDTEVESGDAMDALAARQAEGATIRFVPEAAQPAAVYVEWTATDGTHHKLSQAAATRTLQALYDEWPGGLEEIRASAKFPAGLAIERLSGASEQLGLAETLQDLDSLRIVASNCRQMLNSLRRVLVRHASQPAAAVQRDASRYQWLRDKSPKEWELLVAGLPCWKFDFDAAIDRAMASDLPAQVITADEYLIQDSRSHVGNCTLWWGPDGKGYTSDITKAGRYTREKALRQHRMRPTDIPWLLSEVAPLAQPRVDFQDMPRTYAQQADALDAALVPSNEKGPT